MYTKLVFFIRKQDLTFANKYKLFTYMASIRRHLSIDPFLTSFYREVDDVRSQRGLHESLLPFVDQVTTLFQDASEICVISSHFHISFLLPAADALEKTDCGDRLTLAELLLSLTVT